MLCLNIDLFLVHFFPKQAFLNADNIANCSEIETQSEFVFVSTKTFVVLIFT